MDVTVGSIDYSSLFLGENTIGRGYQRNLALQAIVGPCIAPRDRVCGEHTGNDTA